VKATIEGNVDVVLPGGEGLVRHHQGNVLVPNVLAGELVSCQIHDKKRGAFRGKVNKVLTPSPHRISPACKVADSCGGCAFQCMAASEQAICKTDWVTQNFSAFIDTQTTIIPIQSQQQNFAGRRRARWFMQDRKLGFYKRFSHELVHTDTCFALHQDLDALRNQIEAKLAELPTNIHSIQAVMLDDGFHIILESLDTKPEQINAPNIKDAIWWWKVIDTPSIKAINSPHPLFDVIELAPFKKQNIAIQIGPLDFIQGHQQGNQTLISQILDWCQHSRRVVDLFSGCGNLSLPIAAAFGIKVIGAEVNPSSVKAANANAKRLKLDANYNIINLFGKFNISEFIGADTLIIDPPRTGAKAVVKLIKHLYPKQIIMVNCDPASGARDAKALADAGFKLKALRPLDLFPYAGHVESVSLWVC